MQKDDSVPSAGTKADSSTGDQNMQSSSNDTKPIVVGLPSLSDSQKIAFEKCFHAVNGLTYKEAEKLLYELLFALKKVATIVA
jgi:hypothetical protein